MGKSVFRLREGLAALCVGLLLACAALISFSATAQATDVAHRTSSCSISKVWHKLGPSYVEKLKVSSTSCANGESVVKAYNRCRITAGGVKGHCRTKVDGFGCKETRYTGNPDQFIAVVTCTKSRQAVDFTYSEDT
jgi:hypothetical protein